jgi:hypothetical protein
MVSVSMQLDENDHQLLGFMESNSSELRSIAGKHYGKSPMNTNFGV